MILAVFDPTPHIDQMVALLLTILQPVFWLAVCLGSILAGAHFLTMLATRWGEKRVSGKALAFSLAVHLSAGCGVIAMVPEYQRNLVWLMEDEPQPITIDAVRFESSQTTGELVPGNTPVWDEFADTQREDVERFDRTLTPTEPEEGPPPRPAPPELEQRRTEDLTVRPDRPAELPEQQLDAQEGLQEQAVVPLTPENPELIAREDVAIPAAARDRLDVRAAPGTLADAALQKPKAGAVDRFRPDDVADPNPATIAARVEATAQLVKRDEESDVRNRQGPAPVPPEVEATGQIEKSTTEAAAASAGLRELTRSQMQLPASPNETLPARQRFEAAPRTPQPQEESPLAALEGQIRDTDRAPALPELERQNFSPLRRSDLTRVPATYQLRSVDERKLAAQQFGGTQESEQAVERALQWLASVQHPDGYWDASRYGAGTAKDSTAQHERPNTGADADAGVTALAVLAFLGAGHTPENGEYAATVRKALLWLIGQQSDSGYLGGNADFIAGMYSHGMATFAMAEAYAMLNSKDDTAWLRKALVPAVDFIVDQQISDGSWRYVLVKNTYGDMSMFGWQLMALKSAETGGIQVPSATTEQMVKFLKDMGRGQSGGLAGYRKTDAVSLTMTAEALFCKQMLGLKRSHAASDEAISYLLKRLPDRSSMNYYYWYYGTLAMFQYGGEPWRRWNEQLRELLLSEQSLKGEFAGSWEPRDVWGPYGGRIYSTAVATLCLEVYYRYLPLYKTGGRYEAAAKER